MTRIGLLSDTHGYIHPKVFEFFKNCDEIWHAGDIGSIDVADSLKLFKPLKAVHGNIDDHIIRSEYPKTLIFQCEKIKVWITHIGGYPGNYDYQIRSKIVKNPPDLFICGHSHILKVIYDEKLDFLHINPGAAGKNGIHNVITFIKFVINEDKIEDMEIFEVKRN